MNYIKFNVRMINYLLKTFIEEKRMLNIFQKKTNTDFFFS